MMHFERRDGGHKVLTCGGVPLLVLLLILLLLPLYPACSLMKTPLSASSVTVLEIAKPLRYQQSILPYCLSPGFLLQLKNTKS